jgi:hypothetical protein
MWAPFIESIAYVRGVWVFFTPSPILEHTVSLPCLILVAVNECTCPNGTPTVGTGRTQGTFCEVDGFADCSSCRPGWGLKSVSYGTRGAKICQSESPCLLGSFLSWPHSRQHFPSFITCRTKNRGRDSDVASWSAVNVCTCPNGTPTVGEARTRVTMCEVDGSVDCSGCDRGYELSGRATRGSQTCQSKPRACMCCARLPE